MHDHSSDRVLWLKVFHQGIIDACDPPFITSGRKGREAKANARETTIRQAEAWFNPKSPDFSMVCTSAGIDPDRACNAARGIIAHFREYGEYPAQFAKYLENGSLLRVSD